MQVSVIDRCSGVRVPLEVDPMWTGDDIHAAVEKVLGKDAGACRLFCGGEELQRGGEWRVQDGWLEYGTEVEASASEVGLARQQLLGLGLDPKLVIPDASCVRRPIPPAAIPHLVAAGGNLDLGTPTLLMAAVSAKRMSVAAALLQHGASPNKGDVTGVTPLMTAAARGDVPALRLLLSHGARVDGVDCHGWRALSWAARFGDLASLRLLLHSGASVAEPHTDGTTPLHLAAQHGHTSAVLWLVHHGSPPSARDTRGRSPADCARPLYPSLAEQLVALVK